MKKIFTMLMAGCSLVAFSQMMDRVPNLIPLTINQKTGYINQQGITVIEPQYHIAMFFSEDCNLLNSPNEKIRAFGSSDYATVEKDEVSYRINKNGKRVYQYKKEDLGKCVFPYEAPKYNAFIQNGLYGLISKRNIDSKNFNEFEIYPQYQMLHVLDGDKDNPMIIAVLDNKFGVITKNNEVVIPFMYEDIKTNLSWKMANLFEVSANGKDYYYINKNNHAYNSYTIK